MTKIIWTDTNLLSKLTGQFAIWLGSLNSKNPTKARQHRPEVQATCFVTRFKTENLSRKDRKRATEIAIPGLIPLPQDLLTLYARTIENGHTVEVAALKTSELSKMGKIDHNLNLSPDWRVLTPQGSRIANRRKSVAAGFVAISICAVIYVYAAALSSLTAKLDDARAYMHTVRDKAVSITTAKQEVGVWETLERHDLPESLPTSILTIQSELSKATPSHTYWTQMTWRPGVIVVSGLSSDPFETLSSLARAPGVDSARFSKPLETSGDVRQRFEIELTLGSATS